MRFTFSSRNIKTIFFSGGGVTEKFKNPAATHLDLYVYTVACQLSSNSSRDPLPLSTGSKEEVLLFAQKRGLDYASLNTVNVLWYLYWMMKKRSQQKVSVTQCKGRPRKSSYPLLSTYSSPVFFENHL